MASQSQIDTLRTELTNKLKFINTDDSVDFRYVTYNTLLQWKEVIDSVYKFNLKQQALGINIAEFILESSYDFVLSAKLVDTNEDFLIPEDIKNVVIPSYLSRIENHLTIKGGKNILKASYNYENILTLINADVLTIQDKYLLEELMIHNMKKEKAELDMINYLIKQGRPKSDYSYTIVHLLEALEVLRIYKERFKISQENEILIDKLYKAISITRPNKNMLEQIIYLNSNIAGA